MAEPGAVLSIESTDAGLVLRGEIDAHTAPDLRDALDRALGEGEADVEIDLAGVTFMDSSGLRVVLAATTDARARGRDIVLRDPTPAVRRLVEVTGLADHLALRDDTS